MGQSESSFKRNYEDTVSQLSSVQLREITTRFGEVYAKAGGSKGHLVDREAFSKYFKLPVAVGERLFEAFDAKKNGRISFEEFVCGLAILLHGSFSSKCRLLFQVFNIHGDEGISREELAVMLHAILHSTNTIVMAVSRAEGAAVMSGEDQEQAIKAMVDSAFRNCDITGTGKLLPLEFEYWVKRNPKILDTLLSFRSYDSHGTLGPLLLTSADSDSLDSTVSVPLHSLSREELRGSPLLPSSTAHHHSIPTPSSGGPLKVTHSIRPIRSEPALVSMVTHTQLPPPTQSISEENLQLGSALTAEVTESPAGGKQAPPTSPLAVKMGASSPTLSQVASESDAYTQSGMGTLEPTAAVTESEEFLKSVSLGSQIGSAEASMEVKFTTEPLQEEEEEEEGKGEKEGEEGEVSGEEGKRGGEKGEEGQGEVGEEEEEGEGEGGVEELDQGGSIMQSEELPPLDLNLDLPEEPQEESSFAPSSPLLPTTMETVALELQQMEGEGEEEEQEEGEKEEEEGGGGLEEEGEPLSIKSDGISEGAEVREGLLLPTSESAPEAPTSSAGETMATSVEPPRVIVGFSVEQQLEQGEHQIEPAGPQQSSAGAESLPSHPDLPPAIEEDEEMVAELLTTSTGEDIGPYPVALPQRRPSPFPEVVEGVKEVLYVAWIPSPWTRDILAQPIIKAGKHLTCPGLVADIKAHDPISEIMSAHFPGQMRRSLLSVESVSMDVAGLRRLVDEGCYHAALELTGQFLSAHGQGLGQAGQPTVHTHKTLQMWAARIALLVQMHQFREAEVELTTFEELDNPDLYYQFHSHNYPGKTGSMVPFSLRLLHAQLPSYTNNHQLALDRICLLQHTCQELLAEVQKGFLPLVHEPLSAEDQQVAESLWLERLTRVKFSLANSLVAMQDYMLAIQVYESLLKQLPMLRYELLSAMGRLFLSMGDLSSAQSCFTQVMEEEGKGVRSHINQGLVNVFLSRWQQARESFEAALHLEPTNLTLRNNIAVCAFYQGHLKECISLMESLLGSSPPSSLQPAVFTNMSAAYDLESSSGQAKKLSFIPLLGQHVGEGFPLSSLGIR